MSCPGFSDSDVDLMCCGALTRGSNPPIDAIRIRAVPSPSACSALARAEAISKCGAMPRYGSTSCEGNGSTARSRSASDRPSNADRKKRVSAVTRSRSTSVGTTSRTRSRALMAAANMPLAGSVKPLTRLAVVPIRTRLTEFFSKARRASAVGAKVAMIRCPARPEHFIVNDPLWLDRQGPDLGDDAGGREPLLDWNPHDAPAARLDGVAANDRMLRPVRAFDEHVGLDRLDDLGRCVFVEDDDRVHAREGSQDLRAVLLGVDRTLGPFVAAHRRVGVQPDDQRITQRAGLAKITDVTGVENIEHAIREHHTASGALLLPRVRRGLNASHRDRQGLTSGRTSSTRRTTRNARDGRCRRLWSATSPGTCREAGGSRTDSRPACERPHPACKCPQRDRAARYRISLRRRR